MALWDEGARWGGCKKLSPASTIKWHAWVAIRFEIEGLQNLSSAQQCRDSDSDCLLRHNNGQSLLAPKADPVVGAQGHEDGFKACFVPRDFLGQ